MTNHEKFLDAMNGVDEKFLSVHIRKKCPTAADKAKRYAFAVAAYAAAIVAVAVILPFIIRHGEDPTPKPGGDPVATETTAPMSEDTEARRIDIADIDAKYNGTDPGKQADKVTLDEVKAIISASRQAYAEYDVIVLEDGTLLPTKAKLQNYTLEQLEELSEDKWDTLFEEYYVYFNNMFSVIEEMLDLRFPEKCIFQRDLDDMFPCYYVMNLPDTGFASAEEMLGFDAPREWDEDIYREWMYIGDATDPKTLYYLDSNAEDRTMLYPTAEEYEIQKAVDKWNEERVIPKAVEEFDGLRFTISLDKENYGLDDEVVAYVQIENIGDKAVALWQPVLSHYIYDVRFFEDGVEKPEFWAQQWDYPESEESRFLIPGQAIKTCRTFTPGTPMIDGKEPASMDSTWEITAYVKYLPDPPEELAELDLSKLKTGSVTVDVPHLFGGTEKPSETTPEVTTEPPTETTTTTAPPPPETTTTTPPPETEPPVVIPPLEEGQSISGDFIVNGALAVKYIGRGGDVVIPEGIEFLNDGIFDDCSTITSITFPSTIHGMAFDGGPDRDTLNGYVEHIPTLTHYYMAEGHSMFTSYDGLLITSFDSGATYISWVPPGRTEITVPSFINRGVTSGLNLENIYVEEGHANFTSYNGILFSKDRTELSKLPPKKTVFSMPPEFTQNTLFWPDVCKNIERYEVDPANKKYCSIDGVLYEKRGNKVHLVHVPRNYESYTFPDNCERTWKYPFSGNTGITELVVPLHIKVDYSSWRMFAGCKNLESVTIHQFVDTAEGMFAGCSSLKSIYLPEIIKNISTNCFSGCSSLQTVTIPSSVTWIGDGAFSNCTSLQTVTIPPAVKSIEYGTFDNCTSLVDVYIPDSVTEIDKYAFGNGIDGIITSPNVVIHCSAGSYAAKYAAENGIAYVTE